MKKIIRGLSEILVKEKSKLKFIVIIFIVGVIFGSLFINFISANDRLILINQVEEYFLNIKNLSKDVFGINAFFSNLLNNELKLFIIFILGLSIVGVLVVIFIIFFKGFMLGTTLSTIILKYKLKGLLGCLLYIFPVGILNMFIYFYISLYAVHVSSLFLKTLIRKDKLNFRLFYTKYLIAFIMCFILMALVCLIDSYLTPIITKLFTLII